MFTRVILRTCLAAALLTASLLWLWQVDGQHGHPPRYVGQDYAPLTKELRREAANYPQEPRDADSRESTLADPEAATDREYRWECLLAEDEPASRRRPGVAKMSEV